MERVGVEAEVAKVVGEFGRAVGAEDFARLDAADGFDELVVIGVIGEGQRVVDAEAVLGVGVGGPAGDGDRDGGAEAGEAEFFRRAREGNDGVAAEWATVEDREVAEIDAALFVDAADRMHDPVLKYGHAVLRNELGDFLRFSERVRVNDGRFAFGERVVDDFEQAGDRGGARRQAVMGAAERGFHHEDVGMREFGGFGGGGFVELVIARVEERFVAVVGEQHRGAETVAGGESGELEIAERDGHTVVHFLNAVVRA